MCAIVVKHYVVGSIGAIVVPPSKPGHTFIVTSILMQKLTSKGLFLGLKSKDPYAQLRKVQRVCMSSMQLPYFDIDAIHLKVFHYH